MSIWKQKKFTWRPNSFSAEFLIHINTSKTHLMGVISQDVKLIAGYSQKLILLNTFYNYNKKTVKYSGIPKVVTQHFIRESYFCRYKPHLTYHNLTIEQELRQHLLS